MQFQANQLVGNLLSSLLLRQEDDSDSASGPSAELRLLIFVFTGILVLAWLLFVLLPRQRSHRVRAVVTLTAWQRMFSVLKAVRDPRMRYLVPLFM